MGLAVLAIDLLLVTWMAARVVRDARVHGRRRRLHDLGVVALPSTPAPRGARVRKGLGAAVAAVVVMLAVSRVPPAPAVLTGASSATGPSAPAWGAPAGNDPSGDGGHVDVPKPPAPVAPSETSSSSASITSAPAAGSGAGDAGAPTVAAVPTSATTIRLEWAAVPNASHYGVERSAQPAGWAPVGTTDGNETSFVDDSLTAGTTYYYRVVAFVTGEDPSSSDAVSATTPADLSAPPQFIAVTASTTSVDLVWTNIDGEVGYRIERSADGLTGWVGIGTTGRDVTAFTDAGLTPATTYSYRVIAVGADGESPPSAIYTVGTDADDSPQTTTRDPSSEQAEPAG
jgi:hypothetical protein